MSIHHPAAPAGLLTERQRQIFNWWVEFTARNFYQPSWREAMDHFGISGPNGIRCHLLALEKKGLIVMSSAQARAIVFHRRTPIAEGETL